MGHCHTAKGHWQTALTNSVKEIKKYITHGCTDICMKIVFVNNLFTLSMSNVQLVDMVQQLNVHDTD